MSKKKRFGISEALTRGLSETINVVENNSGMFRNTVLPLSRIELDPENPRKLAIDLTDIRAGIRSDDLLYQQKQDELDRLKELAHTIKTSGVINPVIVYKLNDVYRIVAGERRCLASILAGKQEIDARVFNERPRGFDLKLIQWIENTAREDLTLDERLGNIRDIIREYQLQHANVEVTATVLKNLTGLSLSQCTYYLAVISAPEDVQIEIRNGNIRNLDKAALIASANSGEVRKHAIAACIGGSSLKEIRSIISQERLLKRNQALLKPSKQGRSTSKINMGSTSEVGVIKVLMQSILVRQEYEKYVDVFKSVNWVDLRQTTKAFRKMIELIEVEVAI